MNSDKLTFESKVRQDLRKDSGVRYSPKSSGNKKERESISSIPIPGVSVFIRRTRHNDRGRH